MGKFSEMRDGCKIISECGSLLAEKSSEVNTLSSNMDASYPIVTPWKNSLKTIRKRQFPRVMSILGSSCFTQIASAIIQSVSILVIYLKSTLQEFSMHVYRARLGIYARGASGIEQSALVLHGYPIPLREVCIVFRIYDSVKAFCEWDQLDRLIERLDNSVTFHVVWHGPTSNRIVRVRPHFEIISSGVC